MRKRTMAKGGGVAIVVAAVATWMSGLFDGMGLGPGDGAGLGSGTRVDSGPVTPPADLDEVSAIDDGESDEAFPEIRVLEIVIAGNGYEVRREMNGEVRFEPITLLRLKELAARTTGNDEGIRVLVYRRQTALPQAEMELEEALADAGIEPSAVVHRDELLPAREH